MNRPDDPNRRDFLTGRAVRRKVEQAGDALADAIVDAGEHRPVPVGHDTIRLQTRAMACEWSVVMNPGVPREVMAASDALSLVHGLEAQMTVYRDDSELSRLNRTAHESPQSVEPGLLSLLLACDELAEMTGGAFDATSGPLIALWRRCREEGRIPTQDEIDDTREITGMQRVRLDADAGTASYEREGVELNLGAVGKGYAIDRAVEHLRGEEMADFLVHGGYSSLYAAGDHYGQGGWPVGIRNPLFTERRYATLLLADEGMSTSGSNIQYFRYEGKRYGHILDPRTGWPAEGLLSVTVVAPTATEADALSTAFYVMGLEKALEYCDNHRSVGAILIPAPQRGRALEPVVRNIAEDRLFFVAADADTTIE
ncbi:Thiamine biosynthesis lipoprotein ApbE precursor [Maioricimonas rarisocia]|uniref:FAD:protein FMN transferase n=1 Tax=Maioricimonas rarisocia TaxID=2528026 RepID=A0A517ZFW6_9PLAN|nr:FAD:protein FMN transferase [Maioricimonas rarisocia]QDU41380.1 Thiamine biosynthesis lipoprotein ApbE precursor [Maioricimonas rarisocia]